MNPIHVHVHAWCLNQKIYKDMQKFGAMPNFILDRQPTEETYGKS
jgi:hypothetical protein